MIENESEQITGFSDEVEGVIDDLRIDQPAYQDDKIAPALNSDKEYAELLGSRDLGFFKLGFQLCLKQITSKLDEMNDPVLMAILFKNHEYTMGKQAVVVETVKWANGQDVSDGALLPKESTEAESGNFHPQELTAEIEQRQIDMGNATPVKEKAIREDLSGLTREELEGQYILLTEYIGTLESSLTANSRDMVATSLWAAISDYFNTVMPGTPENDLELPLIERMQVYVNRLRNESWHYLNDTKNEPDFYELPPILSDLLLGEPEYNFTDLEPGEKLNVLVTRLKAELKEKV